MLRSTQRWVALGGPSAETASADGVLGRLLEPLGKDEFWRGYWAKRYLYLQRPVDGFYDSFVTLSDLDFYLQCETNPAALFNANKSGVGAPADVWSHSFESAKGVASVAQPEKLFKLYSEGMTVILNQSERAVPRVGQLCRTLTKELGFLVQANIYITPPAGNAFARHQDDHEVFVLQMFGKKHWSVFPEGGEEESFVISPGDLLYLPRGVDHAARCTDEPSVHITIGVHAAYGFRILEALSQVASELPEFQKAAPPQCAGDELRRQFVEDFERQLAVLVEKTGTGELLRRLGDREVDRQRRGWPGRLSAMLHLQSLGRETVVRPTEGILIRTEEKDGMVEAHFGGNFVKVPKFLEASLRFALEGPEFAIGDLPGLIAPDGKVEMVRKFVAAGLVSIVRL